ncbi:MAG: transglutaminase domain-containing protein, partial [Chloroflexi bacterium]|nr:transglutaminase domain-containing protein [Chloroflexota bacterium]
TTGGNRYWRAMVYDAYDGDGWALSDSLSVVAGPEADEFSMPPFSLRKVISQTVTIYRPGNRVLLGVSQPLPVVDIPARADLLFMPRSGATDELPPPDLFALYSDARLQTGDSYWIWSSRSDADVQSLQRASVVLPTWVRDRYLQLPETLPDRVRRLAVEITAPYQTTYDKASALESYLRRELLYNELIPAPPPGVDGVDYFLFDIRQGYCNYYASAMAVMARAVGIPARMAIGYAGGEYLADSESYRIREKDSHAWVEVFFPGYGWVDFEPTASRPGIARPEALPSPTPAAGGDRNSGSPYPEDEGRYGPEDPLLPEGMEGLGSNSWSVELQRSWRWLGLAALALLGLGAVGSALWRRLEPRGLQPVERLYERMLLYGRGLGIGRADGRHHTPLEMAEALALAVPAGAADVHLVTHLYVRFRYGARDLSETELADGSTAWRRLRLALAKALVRRAWGALRERFAGPTRLARRLLGASASASPVS